MWQRLVFILFLIGTLTACQHSPDWWRQLAVFSSDTEQQFNFNWQLSGDPHVAPLQLFNSPTQIWLQFEADQALPAIFAKHEQGLTPLTYRHKPPYIVIDGEWSNLIFRGGHLEAQASKKPLHAELEEPDQHTVVGLYEVQPFTAETIESIENVELLAVAQPMAIDDLSVEVENVRFFSVSPTDQTVRHVLKRWAIEQGWVFQDQNWEVDMDLPIVSSAQFGSDFITAVAQLMHSTTQSKKPVQACVYTNRVLRVIPSAQLCDLSTASTITMQG